MAPDLERELRGLAIAFPETPDLAAGIRAHLTEPAPRRSRRRGLVLALAVLVAALAAAFAVPQARTAILDFFGLNGVSVTRVDTLPPLPPTEEHPEDLGLGPQMPLDEALARATFDVAIPEDDTYDEVRFSDDLPGGQVSFIWRGEDGKIDLLLSQFRADLDRDYVEKMTGPDTTIEQLEVSGEPALWLDGAPHAFGYVDPDNEFDAVELRLAGPTLLWERGDAILRLEGDLTRDEALALAEGLD